MSTEANKELVRSFYEAGNRGDMESCFALVSDDVCWTNMGDFSLSGTFRGKAEVMDKLLAPLFGQLKAGIQTTIHQLIAEGDTVVARTSGVAETQDGRAYNNDYCQVIRITDGRIVEVIEYMDTRLAARIFG